MSEIFRNKRRCKLMPGLDKISGDLKAYALQNTIIAGTRDDTDDILNSLLCHLVMFNKPDNLVIEYYSYCNGLSTWGGGNKTTPHFRSQIYARNIDDIWRRLTQILMFMSKPFTNEQDSYFSKSNMVIVLNEFDKLIGDDIILARTRLELIKALIVQGHRIGLSFIIVMNEDNQIYKSFIDKFTLRITKKINTDWSNNLLGYDIAKDSGNKSDIWVFNNKSNISIERLHMNYYHETFLKDLGKMYGLAYPMDYWDVIATFKTLDDYSHDELGYMVSNIFRMYIDINTITTKMLKCIYLLAIQNLDSILAKSVSYETIELKAIDIFNLE